MRRAFLILAVCTLVALPLTAFAAPAGGGTAIEVSDIERLVEDVVQFFITIAALAVVGYLVYGGLKMAMSAGNPTKFEEGKKIVTYAIIGAAVIFGVGVIVNTIARFSTDPTLDGPQQLPVSRPPGLQQLAE